ncbi:MAG TPA: addiction module protein [Longimicrobium sp.]|nr:addiction module protein [Longimicrobium sp.]
MSIDELTAAVLDLPPRQRAELIERVEDSLYPIDDIDPATLDRARRELADMKAGRVKGIPMEDLLDELENPTATDLAAVAMRIPIDERAELADRLIASLTGGRTHDPAWEAEMNRRIDEIEAGTAKTVDADEVFAKLKARRHARSLPR